MQRNDGMNYAPQGKPAPVVKEGEFSFAAVALDHGHIYGMCNGLTEAGAKLKWVYDPDPSKVKQFCDKFVQVRAASCEEEILEDPSAGQNLMHIRCLAARLRPADRVGQDPRLKGLARKFTQAAASMRPTC